MSSTEHHSFSGIRSDHWFISASGIGQTNIDHPTVQWDTVTNGSPLPQWRAIIASLGDATTAYTRTGAVKYKSPYFKSNIVVKDFYGGGPGDKYFEDVIYSWLEFPYKPELSTTADNLAVGNFYGSIREVMSPFKGMTFLGELRDTLNLIRRPASALRDGFSAYFKRARRLRSLALRGGDIRRIRKTLSDTWLEYVYGWQPLLGDIQGACKAYIAFSERVETSRVFGKSSDRSGGQTSSGRLYFGNYTRIDVDKASHVEETVIYKGVVRHDFTGILGENANRLIGICGFRLEEFVPTLWELLPYSFVFDAFTNISDILNSTYGLTANLVWKSRSQKVTSVIKLTPRLDRAYLAAFFVGKSYTADAIERPGEISSVDYARSNPTLFVPGLVLELPKSIWTWSNLAALISSRI